MRCNAVEPLLSEYIDNRLSARQTLEVERHLSDCHACTRFLNELRRTVGVLASTPQFTVSEDFMANLQSRLEGLQPNPSPRAWMENIRALFRPRILPVWGAAAAAAALAAVLLLPRAGDDNSSLPVILPQNTAAVTASHQNVVISASDPFADLAATNLAAHVSEEAGVDADSAL